MPFSWVTPHHTYIFHRLNCPRFCQCKSVNYYNQDYCWKVHESFRAGHSSCARSAPITIRPDSCLEFLGTVTIQKVMLIAFGCCLQMLNPGGKALHAGSTKIPHFPRTAVTDCWTHVFPDQKDTENCWKKRRAGIRNQCDRKISASFCFPLSCKKNHHQWDPGNF